MSIQYTLLDKAERYGIPRDRLEVSMFADDLSIRGTVYCLDENGNLQFGVEAMFDKYLHYDEAHAEVQISGLSSHSPEIGRQRAALYRLACDIADLIEQGKTIEQIAGMLNRSVIGNDRYKRLFIDKQYEYKREVPQSE